MLAPQMRQWEADGRYVKTVLFQHKVFCKDVGNPAAPPDRTLLLLHGFPESSLSFHKVVGGLAMFFDRVVLFDFPGYRFSDKPRANDTSRPRTGSASPAPVPASSCWSCVARNCISTQK
jgi:pimeloyl-ACP methyl ester carboxylesterase